MEIQGISTSDTPISSSYFSKFKPPLLPVGKNEKSLNQDSAMAISDQFQQPHLTLRHHSEPPLPKEQPGSFHSKVEYREPNFRQTQAITRAPPKQGIHQAFIKQPKQILLSTNYREGTSPNKAFVSTSQLYLQQPECKTKQDGTSQSKGQCSGFLSEDEKHIRQTHYGRFRSASPFSNTHIGNGELISHKPNLNVNTGGHSQPVRRNDEFTYASKPLVQNAIQAIPQDGTHPTSCTCGAQPRSNSCVKQTSILNKSHIKSNQCDDIFRNDPFCGQFSRINPPVKPLVKSPQIHNTRYGQTTIPKSYFDSLSTRPFLPYDSNNKRYTEKSVPLFHETVSGSSYSSVMNGSRLNGETGFHVNTSDVSHHKHSEMVDRAEGFTDRKAMMFNEAPGQSNYPNSNRCRQKKVQDDVSFQVPQAGSNLQNVSRFESQVECMSTDNNDNNQHNKDCNKGKNRVSHSSSIKKNLNRNISSHKADKVIASFGSPTTMKKADSNQLVQNRSLCLTSDDCHSPVLSRSSTASSVSSGISFGSSYYTHYIVEHGATGARVVAEVIPDSMPNNAASISRSQSLDSVASCESFRTITPEPEYFEENTRAFRALCGIQRTFSDDSIFTCVSRNFSADSDSTLQKHSSSPIAKKDTVHNDFTRWKSIRYDPYVEHVRSLPTFPCHAFTNLPPRKTRSLNCFSHSLKEISGTISPVKPFSSVQPHPNICSPQCLPVPTYPSDHANPSSLSKSLSGSPNDPSLLLFKPLPRYSASDSDTPSPETNIMQYLGPARPVEPAVVYRHGKQQARDDFDAFVGVCGSMLSTEERLHVDELRAYVIDDDGSWALGENFNLLFARVFHDPAIPNEAKRHLVRLMAVSALKDDVILLLHQDRKEHTIMNYANKVESLTPDIQEALALFFCNMFEHPSPSEWLLYISEWGEGGQQISNIRVTTKVAVNALLHPNAKVQEYGTAIMYNLGTKEVKTVVFDDVAPELAMAILQFLGSPRPEELLWRTLTALCRFCYASTEVPALIKMIGPSPSSFRGASDRVDTIIDEIDAKLSRARMY